MPSLGIPLKPKPKPRQRVPSATRGRAGLRRVSLQHFADIGSGSVSPTREQLALPADAFVFACFNSLYKVARHFIRLQGKAWRRAAAPTVLSRSATKQSPLQRFHAEIGSAGRIRLAGSAGGHRTQSHAAAVTPVVLAR